MWNFLILSNEDELNFCLKMTADFTAWCHFIFFFCQKILHPSWWNSWLIYKKTEEKSKLRNIFNHNFNKFAIQSSDNFTIHNVCMCSRMCKYDSTWTVDNSRDGIVRNHTWVWNSKKIFCQIIKLNGKHSPHCRSTNWNWKSVFEVLKCIFGFENAPTFECSFWIMACTY